MVDATDPREGKPSGWLMYGDVRTPETERDALTHAIRTGNDLDGGGS